MHATLADLRDDLADLASIAESGGGQVLRHKARLERTAEHYRPETHAFLSKQAEGLWSEYQGLTRRIHSALGETSAWTDADVPRLTDLKHTAADLLRSFQANLAFVLSAGDWQSPSFLHSMVSQAGAQTGKIVANQNDYKRDGHLDEKSYAERFSAEYLRGTSVFSPETYVTSSGMAALATLVFYLQADGKARGPILAGESIYFENKIVLEKAFPGQVTYANESNASAFLDAARRLRPQAVFLDSLCNSDTLDVPNLSKIIPGLISILPRAAHIVVDNAGLAVSCRPSDYLPTIGRHARLYVIESLNKFHQFGFDRVTGGVVWTPRSFLPTAFNRSRVHLGTMMPDASVLAMPEPSRDLLNRRMVRMGRNAMTLADRIEAHLAAHPSDAVSHVVYPGLRTHSSAAWAKTRWFHGCSLVLAFQPKRQDVPTYRKFVGLAIAAARDAGVPLVAGTSFGFDVTRVYLTAEHATDVTKPFVRISVGTETASEIDAIGSAFISAIESL